MSKALSVLLLLCFSVSLSAQEQGIKWFKGLSWTQVLQKAKAENRYIFLDCYATWCMPCHEMDRYVYPNEAVGRAYNDNFITVRLQMDKTKYDNDTVRTWYLDADGIQKNYGVNAFPTFLIFSPDGKPLHRAVGYKTPEQLIAISKEAFDPEKQYYALLNNYKPGKIDTAELKGLARALKQLGGELPVKMAVEYLSRIPKSQLGKPDNLLLMMEFANSKEVQQVASQYVSKISTKNYLRKQNLSFFRAFSGVTSISDKILQYLAQLNKLELSKQLSLLILFDNNPKAIRIASSYIKKLKSSEIFTKENIPFIKEFTKNSKDLGFRIFRQNSVRIDSLMGFKRYADVVVERIIIQEEYSSHYAKAVKDGIDNIPWLAISKSVWDQYGEETAGKLDILVKSRLYQYFAQNHDKYWAEYIKYYIEKIEKLGYDTTHPQIQFLDVVQLNNFVYEAIFYHSNDDKEINVGLKWMEGVLRRNPTNANNIDTYANLLYKAGKVNEAIKWEETAIKMAALDKATDDAIRSFQEDLAKMKKGIPTWVKDKL